MNFFKSDRFKEGLKSIADPIKNLANNAKTALANRRESKDKASLDLVPIYPRIYWMIYPRPEKIKELSEGLNMKFKDKYNVWNFSEYKYDTTPFNNQVHEYIFVGYPCPPFLDIMKACKSILEWLNKDQENVAVIHCQTTKCRSAVITSCLLSLLKVENHPMEALTYFCNKLRIDDTSFLYPSQHLILKNFANVMDKVQLNKKSFILEKILINEVPKLGDEKDKKAAAKANADNKGEGFRPYIQIFKGSKAIFNYLSKEKPKVYYPSDIAIWFDIGMEVTDDILIRCRHYKNDTERTSVFRVFFNPCFAFNEVVRMNKTEIDFLPDVETSPDFLIDLIIKPDDKENAEAGNIEELREECIKLSAEFIQKKEEYDRQQEEIRKEKERLEALERAEAEAKAKEKEAQEAKEAEINKAKFDIDETPMPDEEEEKDEDILKEVRGEDKEDEKAEGEPAVKNEKVEKILNTIKQESKGDDEELEEDDLDDYISKLEQKTA